VATNEFFNESTAVKSKSVPSIKSRLDSYMQHKENDVIMKFFINNDEQMDYLCGKRLSTGMTFNFPCSKNVISRINYIEKKCINKKVIHVGCLDHTEVIEKKNQI
jgi:hypothetical protein